MVRIRVIVRTMVSVRAEWATEETLKHPMTAYVGVFFLIKIYWVYFRWYILSGIFCPVYIVWYVLSRYLFTGIFCPVCFVQINVVPYILSGYILSGYILSGFILSRCLYPSTVL